jgi:hypothetical protein
MAAYDILYYDFPGHQHFLDGGIITIKPSGAAWTEEELSLGVKVSLDLEDWQLQEIVPNIIDFKVNNKPNPSSLIRGR